MLLLYGLSLHYRTALVILILLQALLCCPICILDIFWWQWSILWSCWCHHISVCPTSPGAELTGKWIIQHKGQDGCSAVNLRPICPDRTWLVLSTNYTTAGMGCRHPLTIMFPSFLPIFFNYLLPLEDCGVMWHVKLLLIGIKAQMSMARNHHYSYSKLCVGISTQHVNTLESLKSFIDLSEQLRQKYIGQAALAHAAEGFELPRGMVRRKQLYCTSLFVWAEHLNGFSPSVMSDFVN